MTDEIPEIQPLVGQRQSSESDKAVQACNDWLRMGIGRTLPSLLEKYNRLKQSKAPTTSLATLQQWSMHFQWAKRAAEFDAAWDERKTIERKAVMDYYLSLDYERVRKLIELADFLEQQIYEQGEGDIYHNVWLPDVKQIGTGEKAERIDIEHFNGALLEQFRKTLDDIASEVGGRIKKTDITSQGNRIKGVIGFDPSEWDNEQEDSGEK